MTDATIYNPKVAWKTILNNVFQLTKETVDNPATYRATIKSIDSNSPGSGQFEIGFCCISYIGNPYPITAIGTNTIDVIDIFRIGLCPTSGKEARIVEPVIDGESLYLSPENFQGLHPLALANAHKYDIPVLWDDIRRNLIELSDCPVSYVDQALKLLRVNATEDGIEFTTESGSDTFIGLLDVTDNDYIGKASNVPIVNVTEDALELIVTEEANFVSLADVPQLYTGSEGYIVRVKTDGTGLEFILLSAFPGFGTTHSLAAYGDHTHTSLPIAGSFSQTVTAVTTFVVTIGQTMANTTYKVCVTPTSMLSAAVFYVTSKSTTQFTVTYLTGITGVVSFDWIIVP